MGHGEFFSYIILSWVDSLTHRTEQQSFLWFPIISKEADTIFEQLSEFIIFTFSPWSYVELLESFLKYTPSDHVDRRNLAQAIAKFKDLDSLFRQVPKKNSKKVWYWTNTGLKLQLWYIPLEGFISGGDFQVNELLNMFILYVRAVSKLLVWGFLPRRIISVLRWKTGFK